MKNLETEDVFSQTGVFGVVDSIVLAATLLVSVAIGVYFSFQSKNTDSYVFGGKNMGVFPVAVSMTATFISAITVIGLPVEMYSHGIVFLWLIPATGVATLIGTVYFVPMIHRLQFDTVFEYLEARFDRSVRVLCSVAVSLQLLVYMGIATYLPALALSAITPISMEWSIVVSSVICTFYSTLGGMKAVIWTDVLQAVIMLIGMLAVFIKGTVMLGLGNILSTAAEGGRLNFFTATRFDPRYRASLWNMFFGITINGTAVIVTSQMMVQRYLACKTVKESNRALAMKVIFVGVLMLIAGFNGLILFYYYKDCDPKLGGYIENRDQSMPYLVAHIFRNFPGLTGLFVAGAYGGTMSTVSSGLNATAAVIVSDYILPWNRNMIDRTQLLLNKLFTLIIGAVVTGLTFLVAASNFPVITLFFLLRGAIYGPLLSVYILGAFIPTANTKAAVANLLSGFAMGLWVTIGKLSYGGNPEFTKPLHLSDELCPVQNVSTWTSTMSTTTEEMNEDVVRPYLADTLYSLSPYLLGPLGCVVGLATGIIVSCLTGDHQTENANPELFVPLISSRRFPRKIRKFFRFGVPERNKEIQPKKYTLGKELREEEFYN